MSYPNPNPILGHDFIAPDIISYRNLYKTLCGGHFNIALYYVLQLQPRFKVYNISCCNMNAFLSFDLFMVYIPECKQHVRTMK